MPALTLWQPWASLVAAGCKSFEFRKWPAPPVFHNRRIAIHAAARPIQRREIADLIEQLMGDDRAMTGLDVGPALDLLEATWRSFGASGQPALPFGDDGPPALPRSAVLCVATLGVPMRGAALAARLGLSHDSERDQHTNWGWPLTDIERLEPYVPARGAQGFWTWHRSEP